MTRIAIYLCCLLAPLMNQAVADVPTIIADYNASVTSDIRERLSRIVNNSQTPADMHFDIALVGIQQHEMAIARFHFLKAAKLSPRNTLYIAWHVFSQSSLPGISRQDLLLLEKKLSIAVNATEGYTAANAFCLRTLAALQTK